MRQPIAAAMARSKREIPHYYLGTTIDMHRAMTWLAEENLKRPVTERLLYGALLIKAVALALREVPELNAVWREGRGRSAARPSTSAWRSRCAAADSSRRRCTTPIAGASAT